MTSQINPSVPADGVPAVKEELRNNLLSAQVELNHGGFATGLTPAGYEAPASDRVIDHLAAIDSRFASLGFADLSDTPMDLAGAGAKFVRVRADEGGLEFVTSAGATNADAVDYTVPLPAAVVRSAADRLAEVLSVKDFGAKGDGGTDDTAAIQAALEAAPANGGIVFFPAGTYRVTSTLTIPGVTDISGGSGGITGTVKPVRLVGQHCPNLLGTPGAGAQGASAIKWDASGSATPCIDASGGSKHWWFGGIEDLALLDNVRNANSVGLQLGSFKGARFTRFGARNFWKNVYQAQTVQTDDLGGWYSTWSQCTFLDARSINIEIMGSMHGCSFVQCRINGSSGTGAKFGNDTSPLNRAGAPLNFYACWIEGNGGYGVEVHNAQAVGFFGGYFELNEGPADIYISGSEATTNLTLISTHHFWTGSAGGASNVVEVNSKSSARMRIKLIGCSMAPASGQPPAVQLINGAASNLSIIAMHNGTNKTSNTMSLYDGPLGDLGGLMAVDCDLAQNQDANLFLISQAWTVV